MIASRQLVYTNWETQGTHITRWNGTKISKHGVKYVATGPQAKLTSAPGACTYHRAVCN